MKIVTRIFTLFLFIFGTTKSFTQIKLIPIAGLNLPNFIYNPSLPNGVSQLINPTVNVGALVEFSIEKKI